MIFWNGSKMHKTLCQATLIECVYYIYCSERPIPNAKFSGRYFLNYFAMVFKSSIVIYDKVAPYKKKPNLKPKIIDKIPIVKETDDIETYPDRFAIETKDIDLLRKLISMGKKVSWFNPDIFTQANYLGILNFENVFIDPYMDTHIIYPTGETVPTDEALRPNIFSGFSIKYKKKIGLNFKDVNNRIDWRGLGWSRYKKYGENIVVTKLISKSKMVNIYNVFSITYMIWRQSKLNATNVKRKTVQKG